VNDVMGRIAALRARFEPAAARPSATTAATGSSKAATTAADFTAALAAATTGAGTSTASATSALTSLLSGASTSTGSSTGVDATSLATLTRMLAGLTGATATGPVTGSTAASPTSGARPAGYDEYAAAIKQIATDEGVPASLLGALVWSESSFNADAVSSAGAKGLAQLMPGTAAGLGVNIDDPIDNLRGGARYLRQMLDRFDTVDEALAAYNAGPNAVQRYGGVPPYAETQNYVAKVLARAATLTGADA
jgi:soluble lytic murein transglycosylase-like protein